MGPRPPDFDEHVIRQSPTFIRWNQLETGAKLRYACREFTKGHGDDEERLMRRIMIARRNNLRDHQTLKRARLEANKDVSSQKVPKLDAEASPPPQDPLVTEAPAPTTATTGRKRRPSAMFSDAEVAKEMDVPAVEATRSYQAWLDLPDGAEFVYNQKYIKGREGHDWLLRKNIWRRMRYRRENKKMVERLRLNHVPSMPPSIDTRTRANVASQIVDQALLSPPTTTEAISATTAVTAQGPAVVAVPKHEPTTTSGDYEVNAAVEAAVAVAESYAKSPYNVVHNPLEAAHANTAALDAAARLAAAAAANCEEADAAVAAAAAAADTAQSFDTGENTAVI